MTAAPTPPAGASVQRCRQEGELARWTHTDRAHGRLELSFRIVGNYTTRIPDHAHVRVHTWPGPAEITDPAELRLMAWMLLDAARWLERNTTPPDVDPDPQLTIRDALQGGTP
jgi:hypothetical protein